MNVTKAEAGKVLEFETQRKKVKDNILNIRKNIKHLTKVWLPTIGVPELYTNLDLALKNIWIKVGSVENELKGQANKASLSSDPFIVLTSSQGMTTLKRYNDKLMNLQSELNDIYVTMQKYRNGELTEKDYPRIAKVTRTWTGKEERINMPEGTQPPTSDTRVELKRDDKRGGAWNFISPVVFPVLISAAAIFGVWFIGKRMMKRKVIRLERA